MHEFGRLFLIVSLASQFPIAVDVTVKYSFRMEAYISSCSSSTESLIWFHLLLVKDPEKESQRVLNCREYTCTKNMDCVRKVRLILKRASHEIFS